MLTCDRPHLRLQPASGRAWAVRAMALANLWTTANHRIIGSAGSLLGTTAVTSGLGYVYWVLAARELPAAAVGFAAAAIAAMTLLGNVGMLGLGTLLIRELPRQPGREASLIGTALVLAGLAATALGLLFAGLAPIVSAELAPLASNLGSSALFALGVSLTAITLVLDQALIGLLRGRLQLGRNTLFAVAKLGALYVVSAGFADATGLTVYATWAAGNLISLGVLAGVVVVQGAPRLRRLEWGALRGLGRAALTHHVLNLALQAPYLLLPLIVTALLSTTMNAYYYIASMVAGLVFIGPIHLSTALYATGARAPHALAHKLRFTLALSVGVAVLANCVLLVGAGHVLSLFGAAYAEQAEWSLRVLGLAVFGLIVKDHYVVICRLQDRVGRAALVVAAGGLLELILAAIGATLAGLIGLSVGWLTATVVEGLYMTPWVYRAAVAAARIDSMPADQATLEPVVSDAGARA